jgi:Phosphotransferase enzyme family
VLMQEVAGSDRYDAIGPELDRMIDLLIDLQASAAGDVADLLALGFPDWRGPALGAGIGDLVERRAGDIDAADLGVLRAFVADLPVRFAAVAACGLPDTLVHGDFHPGNVRGDRDRLVLLDWGDCGGVQPLLDQAAFLDVRPAEAIGLRRHWHDRWRAILPGSDPDGAARLLGPVAAARQALIYQGFLDGIEPSEWPYHVEDVPRWLRRTADLVRAEGSSVLR